MGGGAGPPGKDGEHDRGSAPENTRPRKGPAGRDGPPRSGDGATCRHDEVFQGLPAGPSARSRASHSSTVSVSPRRPAVDRGGLERGLERLARRDPRGLERVPEGLAAAGRSRPSPASRKRRRRRRGARARAGRMRTTALSTRGGGWKAPRGHDAIDVHLASLLQEHGEQAPVLRPRRRGQPLRHLALHEAAPRRETAPAWSRSEKRMGLGQVVGQVAHHRDPPRLRASGRQRRRRRSRRGPRRPPAADRRRPSSPRSTRAMSRSRSTATTRGAARQQPRGQVAQPRPQLHHRARPAAPRRAGRCRRGPPRRRGSSAPSSSWPAGRTCRAAPAGTGGGTSGTGPEPPARVGVERRAGALARAAAPRCRPPRSWRRCRCRAAAAARSPAGPRTRRPAPAPPPAAGRWPPPRRTAPPGRAAARARRGRASAASAPTMASW